MKKWVAFSLAAAAVACVPGVASATSATTVQDTYTTFDFVGLCTDCAGYGKAHLTMKNFQPEISVGQSEGWYEKIYDADGNWIDSIRHPAGNTFVSFVYEGSNLFPAFTVLGSSPRIRLSGVFSSSDAASIDFSLSAYDDGPLDELGRPVGLFFWSESNGDWALGDLSGAKDYGTDGIWTLNTSNQVPEPEGMAYALPALLGLAALRRRRIVAASSGR